MIIKILTRKSPSYQSLLEYILQEGKNKDGQPEIITHNLRSKERDIQGYVSEFMQNEAMRQYPRKDNIMLYHEILSFSRSDKKEISNEKLLDIANEYIKQRGIEGVYVGAIHSNDTHHKHIHFMVSGVQFRNGLAHRLTHESLQELKLTMQEYHTTKYPEIEHSNCKHGANKPYLTNKEFQLAQRTNRNTIKHEIQHIINTCFQQAKSRSEFLQLLQEQGLYHYERKGIPEGITYDKYKFRFTRFGITLSDLPITTKDMKKEQQTLDEIQWLRQATPQKDRLLDFEEAAISFNECKLQDLYNMLDELEEEKHKLIVQLEYESTPELQKAFEEVEERQSRLTERAEELSLEVEVERFSNLEKDNPVEDKDITNDPEKEGDINLTDDLEELREEREEDRELEEDRDIDF